MSYSYVACMKRYCFCIRYCWAVELFNCSTANIQKIAHCYAYSGICCRKVSVRLSVTMRYCVKTVKHIVAIISPLDRPIVLVFLLTGASNTWLVWKFPPRSRCISETVKDIDIAILADYHKVVYPLSYFTCSILRRFRDYRRHFDDLRDELRASPLCQPDRLCVALDRLTPGSTRNAAMPSVLPGV